MRARRHDAIAHEIGPAHRPAFRRQGRAARGRIHFMDDVVFLRIQALRSDGCRRAGLQLKHEHDRPGAVRGDKIQGATIVVMGIFQPVQIPQVTSRISL